MSRFYEKNYDGMGFDLNCWHAERTNNNGKITVFVQNYEDNRECFVIIENNEITKLTTVKDKEELPIDYIPEYLKKNILSYNRWASKKGF